MYQLQELDSQAIAASGFEVAVIDYSADGSEDGRLGPTGLALMHEQGIKALAYLSIGEAEQYRYYFDSSWTGWFGHPTTDAPCWLGRTNPAWRGNYKVQFWSEAWQQVVLDYLDRILLDGFDGVYLDIVDGWEYWSDPDNREIITLSPQEAADRMTELVNRVAAHARLTRGVPEFLVFPQNGEGILAFDGDGRLAPGAFVGAISGIGVEDLYFDETTPQPDSETSQRRGWLNLIRDSGRPVLVVDYVDRGTRPVAPIVADFRGLAIADGYIPYVARTDRELRLINSIPGQP